MHWRAEIPVYLGLMKNYNLSIVIILRHVKCQTKLNHRYWCIIPARQCVPILNNESSKHFFYISLAKLLIII